MMINDDGIKLLKEFEGCKLHSYQDQKGIWTIGYGHTAPELHEGICITQLDADHLFEQDILKFSNGVQGLVGPKLNENQFSALVCFSYNVGISNLRVSKLLHFVNISQFELAAEEFPRWDHVGGKEAEGLLRRRMAERSLFLK